ncbi:MAG: ATP-dependent Clp protease ATP-binding subunit ClpX, partial [Thiotrichaceae bacterium]|nr:ATP-dependent Clp protease ATP-binding subunit ClpX [Thiotrichaceae bacterium]
MSNLSAQCSFCSITSSQNTPLISGADGYICEACVQLANQVIKTWGGKQTINEDWDLPTPATIKARLDDYVIGQDLAKEILSVAVYNHYKR